MNAPLFHATSLAAIRDETGWVVGLSDHEFDAEHYLQFQRGHISDAKDKALGHDTYYVELDDQSNSCYGGIERIDLSTNAINIVLDDKGSQSLGLHKDVLITFDADNRTLDSLRTGLNAVFAGTDLVRDRTGK